MHFGYPSKLKQNFENDIFRNHPSGGEISKLHFHNFCVDRNIYLLNVTKNVFCVDRKMYFLTPPANAHWYYMSYECARALSITPGL